MLILPFYRACEKLKSEAGVVRSYQAYSAGAGGAPRLLAPRSTREKKWRIRALFTRKEDPARELSSRNETLARELSSRNETLAGELSSRRESLARELSSRNEALARELSSRMESRLGADPSERSLLKRHRSCGLQRQPQRV